MTDDNSKQEGQEVSVWPGRYWIRAKVERWPHKGGIYGGVELKLFQVDISEQEVKALLEPLGLIYDMENEEYPYIKSQVAETFTEEQADQLIAWLEEIKDGVKAWKDPALKPGGEGMGVGAIAVGVGDGFYMMDHMDGYDLPFKVWAYYDLDSSEYLYQEPTPEDRLRDDIRKAVSMMPLEALQKLRKWMDKHDRE